MYSKAKNRNDLIFMHGASKIREALIQSRVSMLTFHMIKEKLSEQMKLWEKSYLLEIDKLHLFLQKLSSLSLISFVFRP